MSTRAQTAQQKKAFLEAFAEYGNVTTAATLAGCERRTVYKWQEHDDQFAVAYREAELQATEVLEAEARRRAVEGISRLKFDRGSAVLDPATGNPYLEREYSDTLLIFLLKARAPDKYRDRWEGKIIPDGDGLIPVRAVDYRDGLAVVLPQGDTDG